jgi:hypothetical protein
MRAQSSNLVAQVEGALFDIFEKNETGLGVFAEAGEPEQRESNECYKH